MKPDDIISKLKTKGVIQGVQTIEKIEAKITRKDKVTCLLENLPESARTDLIHALKETNQDGLAEMLINKTGTGNYVKLNMFTLILAQFCSFVTHTYQYFDTIFTLYVI